MRGNSKKLCILILLVLLVALGIFCYFISDEITSEYHPTNFDLAQTRTFLRENPKYLFKTVPLRNKTGICYLNTFFQTVMSIPELVEFFIYTDFKINQKCSILFQKSVYEYINSSKYDLVDFLLKMSSIKDLNCYLRITGGGDPGYLIEKIFEALREESNFFDDFYIKKQTKFECTNCKKQNNNSEEFVLMPADMSKSTQSAVINYLHKTEELEPNFRHYLCKHCKTVDKHMNLEICVFLPKFLMVEIKRVGIEYKKEFHHDGLCLSSKDMFLRGKSYSLFAQIYFCKGKDRNHVYASVCKNGEWVLCDDMKIQRGQKFEEKNSNSWILLYKCPD